MEPGLRALSDRATHGYGETLRFLAERQGALPEPGDLFLLEESADFPVEWLVLEEVEASAWRVVAADLHPAIGSRDIALELEAWAGPVSLRCGISAVVPQTSFRPDLRTGVVPRDVFEQARSKHSEVEAGKVQASVLEREVDQESEYLDWFEDVLEPAKAALGFSHDAPSIPVFDEAGDLPRDVRSSGGRFHGWQMAAAILATLGAALFLTQVWSGIGERSPRDLGSRPLINPQLEWFQPATDAVRGDDREIVLAPHAEWLTMVLETWDPALFPAYEVELVAVSSAEVIWRDDQLQRQGASEIVFTLPASMTPPGAYLLRLSGRQESGTKLLEEFRFAVSSSSE